MCIRDSNSSDELLPFHEASFKLAEKSKSPIVQMCIRDRGNSVQKLDKIPEAQNDMIFSIVCEEIGRAHV